MKNEPSRRTVITAIILKDLREFSRDRLWMILTPVSLIFMTVLFLVLPDSVDESITLGVYPSDAADFFSTLTARGAGEFNGLQIIGFSDETQLADSVLQMSGAIAIGIAFPSGFTDITTYGSAESLSVYVSESVPQEMRLAFASGVREIVYATRAVFTGKDPLSELPISLPDLQSVILGEDLAGRHIPIREKIRPILVTMILMIEAIALAGLVSVEIEHRTVTALLVTPAKVSDFLTAKCITGAILAVSQAILFLLVTGGFAFDMFTVSVLILLGAGMASAAGMLSGACGRDFMSTLFFGMIFLIPLMIPALSVLFPGKPALIVRLLPSYGLVEAMYAVIGKGMGWSYVAPHIQTTLVWDSVLLATAFFVLRRRVESL